MKNRERTKVNAQEENLKSDSTKEIQEIIKKTKGVSDAEKEHFKCTRHSRNCIIAATSWWQQHHRGLGGMKVTVAASQQQWCHGSSAITTAVARRRNCRMKRA